MIFFKFKKHLIFIELYNLKKKLCYFIRLIIKCITDYFIIGRNIFEIIIKNYLNGRLTLRNDRI
jgi:hypothetical protein